ncbi:MAG: hypothetical protein WC960_03515, partial [Bacteroidales bacterium]
MSRVVIKNIGKLLQIEESPIASPKSGDSLLRVESLSNAFLIIEGEKIDSFGPMEQLPQEYSLKEECSTPPLY